MSRNLVMITLLSIPLTACAGNSMKAHYSKAMVQPVAIDRTTPEQITIQYTTPPESLFYSPGINYEIKDGVIRVAIDRCGIRDKCAPMAKAELPAEGWRSKVEIPYQGQKVVMLYTDTEEQIFP